MISQKQWRIAGGCALAGAAVMAIYSVRSDVLHQSLLFSVSFFSDKVTVEPGGPSGWFCMGFWSVFAGLIGSALYLAFIDWRYINLQYAIEKRDILKRTIHSKEFRESLRAGAERNAATPSESD